MVSIDSGERKTQMALAVFTEDDAGNGGDLRAFEQYLRGLAAVAADARDIRESIERAGRFFANAAQLIESRQK